MSNGGLAFEGSVPVTTGSNAIGISAVDAGNHASTKNYTVTVPTGGAKSYTYDHAGNMTGDGSRTFLWDALNQLVKITSAGGASSEFTYDALGRRVKIVEKNAGGTVTETRHFVWDGMEIAERRDAAGTLVRRYYPNGYVDGVAAEPDVSEQLLSLRDHLGSVRATVYEEDAYSIYQDYDLYGDGSVSDLTDFGYTGHYYHAASGLTLAPFRAYDANLGRWISRDPLKNVELNLGPNLYEYVWNSPIKYFDFDGRAPTSIPNWAVNPVPQSLTDPRIPDAGRDNYRKAMQNQANKTKCYGTAAAAVPLMVGAAVAAPAAYAWALANPGAAMAAAEFGLAASGASPEGPPQSVAETFGDLFNRFITEPIKNLFCN